MCHSNEPRWLLKTKKKKKNIKLKKNIFSLHLEFCLNSRHFILTAKVELPVLISEPFEHCKQFKNFWPSKTINGIIKYGNNVSIIKTISYDKINEF